MRARITLLAAGAALLAVILFAIPLGVFAARGYLNDERLELQRSAASSAASARGDLNGAAATRAGATGEVEVSVYDDRGRRLSGPGPRTVDATVRAALRGQETTATTDDQISVAAPVSDGDQVTGAVLLRTGLGPVHHRTVQAWLALVGIGLLAVALSGLVARVLARRLAGPIDRLTDTARRMGEGDLSVRAVPSGVPEVDTLATTLNASAGQLEAMIARERGFSAEVSHQLRTPLTGLRLELETAQDAPQESMGAILEQLLATVDRLDATIADVITLAHDLPGSQSVVLAALLADVQQRWHATLAAESRPLRIASGPGLPSTVSISAAAAAQIVDVLVGNAWTHGRGAVTVAIREAATAVAIDVCDEGPVLTTEPHELFRRRPDPDGHGIGLAFARRLAEAEGARLVLGCPDPPTFSLVIPAAGPGHAEESVRPPPR